MSEPFEPQSSFEVRCENCAVTFPVGTRECIHCGQRIGRPGWKDAAVGVMAKPAMSRLAEAW